MKDYLGHPIRRDDKIVHAVVGHDEAGRPIAALKDGIVVRVEGRRFRYARIRDGEPDYRHVQWMGPVEDDQFKTIAVVA